MSFEGLFAGVLLLAFCLPWILMPLMRRTPVTDGGYAQTQNRLRQDYDRVLTNLRDLEEDFSSGKIQQEDYETEREILMQRGVTLLKQLEKKAHG